MKLLSEGLSSKKKNISKYIKIYSEKYIVHIYINLKNM